MSRAAVAALGGIDILVINAAIQILDDWQRVTRADFDRQIAVNLRSSLELLQSIRAGHKDLLDGIRKEKALTPDLEAKLKSILENFTKSFA